MISDKAAVNLARQRWELTDRTGDDFTVILRGNRSTPDPRGNVSVELKVVDNDGLFYSASVNLSIYSFGGQPGEPKVSTTGWTGPADPKGLRACAAICTLAAEILDEWSAA